MNIPGYIKNNLLFKIASANAFLVAVRMGFSLFTQKIFAIYIGADGIAQVGDLKNIISFLDQFSILGTSNGLVKYISENKDDKKQLNRLFSTTFIFAAIASFFSFIILFFGSGLLNDLVFGTDNKYEYIFKILSFLIPFIGINAILGSLINSLSNYKLYSRLNLFAIIVSTIVIVCLTMMNGISGALLAICLIPIIQFLSYLIFFLKESLVYINLSKIFSSFSFKNKLLSYSFMTIIVVFFINVTDVFIRNLIEKTVSKSDAGYWTAMTSVSKIYMQFLAAIFPLYILPKYSNIKNTFEFRKEVMMIYKMLLPLIIIGMLLVYLFRIFLIKSLYTEDFLAMSNLFRWQLVGDFIKFVAIVLSYQFLAKRQIGYFVFTELLSVFLFYVFSVYFINIYGTEGVVIAHFVRYILYFLVVIYIMRNSFFGENREFK